MTSTRTVLGLVFLLVLVAAPVRADTPEQKAAALEAKYRELFRVDTWRAHDARIDVARRLGALDCDAARTVLQTILKAGISLDEKLLATLSLGRIATRAVVDDLVSRVEKLDHPALYVALADGLARCEDGGVKAWIAGEGIAGAGGGTLEALVHAAGELRLSEATGAIAALWEKNQGKRAEAALCHEVVLALGKIGGDEARKVVLAAAAHDDWKVRLAAADALARFGGGNEAVLGAMRVLLAEGTPTVRRIAARRAGEEKVIEIGPELIEALNDQRLAVRHEAHGALVAITGKNLGHDAETWRQWWKDRAENQGRTVTVAEYYGFGIWSDRVLFIVDTSGSMSWPWRKEPKRIEVARSELAKVLGKLSEDTLFNVIAFSDKVRAWQSRGEVEATEKNVGKALRWIEKSFEADGDTWTWAALREAFEKNDEFDTLYLLSDGMPSDGELISPEGLVCRVKDWNRFRCVTVNTIGLTLENMDRGMPNLNEDLGAMKRFMKTLAAATGGKFVPVTRAPR